MCVIACFKPNQMPPKDMLFNAVYNNWHSYGLVTKIDNKLDIKRVVPENGEVDPQEVYDALHADVDYERFLHLRHNTAGATNLENCHPFDLYYNEKTGRHLVFMHNGTLYPYVDKKWDYQTNKFVENPGGPSDSKKFAEELSEYIAAMNFGTGVGDIHHELFKKVVIGNWSGSNRGLIIASDQAPFFIDQWKEVGPHGNKFKASNDDYFDSVKRGPEFTRRSLREAKKKEEAKRNSGITPLRDVAIKKRHGFYDLRDSLVNVIEDDDFLTREGVSALGYASRDELEQLYSDKATCLTVMDWVFTEYAVMLEELTESQQKHYAATKMIAELKGQIKLIEEEREKGSRKGKKAA